MAGAACNAPGSVSLWASDILDFSSEYNTGADGWGARAALGPPRVYPKHGDITGAWAPGNITNNEHITLKFAEALYVDQLEVYETYNPGGISRVVARTESGEWVPIYTAPGPPVLINHSRIFDVPMQPTSYRTDTLKIVLDCSAADTWVEIDAVKMTGVISRLDSPPPMTKLSDDLFNLVDCEDFSDVTFEVEGHTVKGHRAILSARSKYFRAMFSDAAGKFCHMPSGEPVVLGNISYDAFKVMMQYLYTNRILPGSTPSSLVELIRAADMYAMEDLGKVATYELNVMMCTGNVVEIYREAIEKLPVLDVVEKLCTDCISKNLQEVSKTKAFCNLPQELMLNLIQICTANMKIS